MNAPPKYEGKDTKHNLQLATENPKLEKEHVKIDVAEMQRFAEMVENEHKRGLLEGSIPLQIDDSSKCSSAVQQGVVNCRNQTGGGQPNKHGHADLEWHRRERHWQDRIQWDIALGLIKQLFGRTYPFLIRLGKGLPVEELENEWINETTWPEAMKPISPSNWRTRR
jgi:hypothetical protein